MKLAATSLLALLDDIATVLDDISVMSKVAAKKTAGVLGDDLALNAQQVAGIRAERELPVVWAVALGSLKNKAILVPAAMAISVFAPWLITPLLMVGGAYLCFEGFEKWAHPLLHGKDDQAHHAALTQALIDPDVDMVAFEKDKISGAIRTDFVLSAEIIAITLGVVKTASLTEQLTVLCVIALVMTVGVYGFVAAIVKMDDVGLYMSRRQTHGLLMDGVRRLGLMLVSAAAPLMKLLSVVGTVAMFMVGGGIVTHGIPGTHEFNLHVQGVLEPLPVLGPVMSTVSSAMLDTLGGVMVGALTLVLWTLGKRLINRG